MKQSKRAMIYGLSFLILNPLAVFANTDAPTYIPEHRKVDYQELNKALKEIHSKYTPRDFLAIDKIREDFLTTFKTFDTAIKAGRIKLKGRVQEGDYRLAKNYSKTLGEKYPTIRKKYTGQDSVSTDQPQKIKEPITVESFSDDQNPENLFLNQVDDSILSKEIAPPMDSEVIDYILDNYYTAKGFVDKSKAQSLPGQLYTPESSPVLTLLKGKPSENIAVAETVVISKEEPSPTDDLEDKVSPIDEYVLKIKDEEAEVISADLDRALALRQNQARFNLGKAKSNSIFKANQPSKAPVRVLSRDRLMDLDDDVIQIQIN